MCWVLGGAAVVLFFIYAASIKVSCELCGNTLKRKRYEAEVDGKRLTICPNCNRSLEAKRSREATRAVLEDGRVRALSQPPEDAFLKLLDRVATAKGSGTRAAIVARAKSMDFTPRQRLQLLLEVSKAETEATLEKVDALKSKAAKRRCLEETLAMAPDGRGPGRNAGRSDSVARRGTGHTRCRRGV